MTRSSRAKGTKILRLSALILRVVQRQTAASASTSPARIGQHLLTAGSPSTTCTKPPRRSTHAPSFSVSMGQVAGSFPGGGGQPFFPFGDPPTGSLGIPTGGSGSLGIPTGGSGSLGTPTGGRGSLGTPTGGKGSLGTPTGGRGSLGTPTGGRGSLGIPTGGRGSLGTGRLGSVAGVLGVLGVGLQEPQSGSTVVEVVAEEMERVAMRRRDKSLKESMVVSGRRGEGEGELYKKRGSENGRRKSTNPKRQSM